MGLNFLGITMFSIEHILATLTCVLIIVALFFTRKFFMNNKKADVIFRVTLALALIISEIGVTIIKIVPKTGPLVFLTIPRPLCGMLLWTSAIALLSNSSRLMKKFYPLFLTGATLSLVVCEIPEANFPSFRAFQYFVCHGGFLIGACYFVFTRKINKFSIKDFGWSALIIAALGGMMSFLYVTDKYIFPDDFYVMGTGMPAFSDIYEACGQVGYSLIYMSSITLIMFIFSLITYYCTKKRDDNEITPSYYHNKFFDLYTHKLTVKTRYTILAILYVAFLYMIAWQTSIANLNVNGVIPEAVFTDSFMIGSGIFLGVYWFIMMFVAVFNEIAYYYSLENK